ncbi:hypothetical protein LX32DRAFT_650386 [Colletotrichum zoysiae]|uniref:Uncharacterized protein n=1 Tax=Colletotrichum zoysiae TaxID=1216348 RepID=A0AAD9HQD9_9PEZI|nr:hypothetical protein LX32DRAFT_650386 [Colletotrichum zoysiae]
MAGGIGVQYSAQGRRLRLAWLPWRDEVIPQRWTKGDETSRQPASQPASQPAQHPWMVGSLFNIWRTRQMMLRYAEVINNYLLYYPYTHASQQWTELHPPNTWVVTLLLRYYQISRMKVLSVGTYHLLEGWRSGAFSPSNQNVTKYKTDT